MILERFVEKRQGYGWQMSSMDPFDEFEFKPLTDGLGFHKKSISLKDGLKSTGVLSDEMQGIPLTLPKSMIEETSQKATKKHSFEDVLSALEKTPLKRSAANSELQFTEPLPRERDTSSKRQAMELELPLTPQSKKPAPIQSPFPQPEAYKSPIGKGVNINIKPAPLSIEAKREQAQIGTRRGAADSPQRKLVPTSCSFASAFLDGIIVMALSLVFLIALLMVTKVDMVLVLNNVDKDRMTQLSLFILFVAVMQMYAIIARSFFGRTLGEWTFELQLGQDSEQGLESYPLKIALRSLITTGTGLLLLPLISLLVRRDVAGQLSGVQLYRQRI